MNLLTKLFGSSTPELDAQAVSARLAEDQPPLILDVREPQEYRRGHIAGARPIPLGALAQRMGALPRDREIVCVCQSGNRSRAAVNQLAAAGYQALNLRGGMLAWAGANLPVKTGDR